MKSFWKKALLIVFTAILVFSMTAFAACGDNKVPAPTEKFTVEGVVVSELGPLSGVTVKLGEDSKTTGTEGSYSFEVSAGEYTLTFSKSGYTDVQKSVKTADAEDGTVKLNVTMTVKPKEYVVISGTISGDEGGIADATVSCSALSETVIADVNGTYALPQLEKNGSYTFTFAASGYISAEKTLNALDIEGNTHTLDVTLEKIPEEQLAAVSGIVTADYPEGVLAGVTVKIGTTEVKTDADGVYNLQTSRNTCTIEFIKDGYATVTEEISDEDVADGAHTLNAELVRNAVLAGKTNAEVVAEYATMNDIAVSGQLKDQIHAGNSWQVGGADGSVSEILSEGYRLESKQDNANDEFRRYIYGKMTVSAENKIFDFWGRTFGDATEFTVKVINPQTLESAFVKAENTEDVWASFNSETYARFSYDLTDFIGEKIIFTFGVRKAALTVERVSFGTGEFVFGRTTQVEFDKAKTLELTQKASYENAEVRSAFDTVGNIEGKNTDNDYATKNARFYACYVGQNTATDADLFMYVYAKVNITGANARMSIRWYNDRAPFMRVAAYDVKGRLLQTVNVAKGSGDTETSTVDLTDCIGKTVVLAIGMTSGERLDLQKISFARYSYTLNGTVTLPQDGEYELSKVSFKLNDNTLTSSEDGFTFDTTTGAYTLNLKVDDTGTLTVSYDNSDIIDNTQKLLGATYALSGAATQDEVTQNFELQQNSNAPQAISITLNADTVALTDEAAAIKLGDHDFTYADGKWSLDGLTMAEAVELGNVTITLKGKYANIYADPSFTLNTGDYSGGSAEKEITLEEKDILPGLTFSQLQATNIKEVPFLSSSGKTAIGNLWNEGGAIDSECDVIVEGYRMTSKTDNANDEYRRYIYGKLDVTANNDTLTLYGRTFGTETEFAVKVIDFTTFEGTFIQATGSNTIWQKYNGSDYGKYTYNLSGFDGKTVIVAIGVRKAALTLESILLSADGTFAFGRTSAAALQDLQAVNIATGTRFSAGSNPKIQETFVTVGAAKVDNNRWMLVDARGDNTDGAQPHSYVYCKTNITSANARMSIRWSSYNNGPMALTKVLAVNAQDNSVIHLYSGNNSVNGEWCESRFDLTECVGKEVILAIGMSYGNRMGIDWIQFDRMSYILTGTVTLPQDGEYELSKVSFKLNDNTLTSSEDGFTFDTTTGAYTLNLKVDDTGTLTVSYDNSDIIDNTQKLLGATYALSGAATQDEVTQNFELQQNSNAPQAISITLNADTVALTDEAAAIKLGDHDFTYADGKWSLDGLTMAEAVELGNVTITLKGKYANIYADPSFTLNTGDYSGGSAEKEITLEEKDILPGLTFSQMQNAKTLDYDYYQGYRAHNILRSFAKSNPLRSEEQNEGDTIRVIENSAKSASEFNGYIYGVRTISEATKTMTVNMRTHDTSNDTIFGVMVVDLESGARALIGGLRTSRQNSYNDVTFDLTEYVGKKVLIATGIFYTDECTRWDVQYVMHHIRFYNLGSDWGRTVDTLAENLLTNTDVAGQRINDFVGSAKDKDKSNYIFSTWGTASKNFQSADYELGAREGALIKTRNDEQNVENCVFLYSKFAITKQNSYLRFNARGFGGNMPELAVTVYSLGTNGEVVEKIITPDLSAFDLNGNQVTDMGNGWINGKWSTDNYTQFKWDLSEFEGKEVVIMIGLRNTQGGENKIAIQEIHLEAKLQDNNQGNN